jgi:hypothetical protein
MSPKLLSKLLRLNPLQCAICELESKTGIGICEICIAQQPCIKSACYQCGLPLDGRLLSGGRCARCIIKRPELDSCQALFHFKPPLVRLIIQHKFQRRLDIGASLGGAIGRAVQPMLSGTSCRRKARATASGSSASQTHESKRIQSSLGAHPGCNGSKRNPFLQQLDRTNSQHHTADRISRRWGAPEKPQGSICDPRFKNREKLAQRHYYR